MARYKIGWKASTQQVAVTNYADADLSGYTNIGNFYHDQTEDVLGNNPEAGHAENHVLFHHVRDALYHVDVEDMARLTIRTIPGAVTVDWKTALVGEFNVGETKLMKATVVNTFGVANVAGVWSSSVPAKATVNATTGLVTAVADGATNIIFTTTDGARTALKAITVAV
jgi:hypothetical protein